METILNILAAIRTPQTAEDIKRYLQGVDGLHLTLVRANGHLPLSEGSSETDVIICELSDSSEAAVEAMEKLLGKEHEGRSVFVIGSVNNLDLMRRLMRIGVRDILQNPVNRQDLLALMEKLLQEKRTHSGLSGDQKKKVLAFFNAKGSCGATMIAVNTAASLAARHKAKVGLIDFDIQFGKAALLFDIKPQGTVLDALREHERMDTVLLKALMNQHPTGVNILASPASLNPASEIHEAAVHRVIETAASAYDFVILDMPHLIAGWTIEALRSADTIFIVTQNNLGAIRDARQLLDFLLAQGFSPKNIEIINNRDAAKSPSVTIEQMRKVLQHDHLHRIRNDYVAAASSEDQGKPLAKTAPQSVLCQDIDGLADSIWNTLYEGKEQPAPKASWLDKWVRRYPQGSLPEA